MSMVLVIEHTGICGWEVGVARRNVETVEMTSALPTGLPGPCIWGQAMDFKVLRRLV
jgi:hypothetical protein